MSSGFGTSGENSCAGHTRGPRAIGVALPGRKARYRHHMPRMRAKPIGLPTHLVTGHHAMRALPNAARHITWELLVTFWEAHCRPLPTANHDLAALGHTDVSTFRRHRDVIIYALSQVSPILAEWRADEEFHLAKRRKHAKRIGAMGAAARRMQKTEGVAAPPPNPIPAMATTAAYANPNVDMNARASAKRRSAGVANGGMADSTPNHAPERTNDRLGDLPTHLDQKDRDAHTPWTLDPSVLPPTERPEPDLIAA